MIVWLASYPRSGNSFLRLVIEDVFRIPTFSIYDEVPVFYGPDRLELAAPESPLCTAKQGSTYDRNKLIEIARRSELLHFVKTHEGPIDDSPALYIERDGRAACVSLLHFLTARGRAIPMQRVIKGMGEYGSWSTHYAKWADRQRTTFMRFESAIKDVPGVVNLISRTFSLEPKGEFTRTLAVMRERNPVVFRKGDNAANIAELTAEDEALFWELHGDSMRQRGYA